MCEFYCISGAIDYFFNYDYRVGIKTMQNGEQLGDNLNRFVNGCKHAHHYIIDFHDQENDEKGIYFAHCWCNEVFMFFNFVLF